MATKALDFVIDATPKGRAAFDRYIEAFSCQDTDTFTKFYTPDILLRLGAVTLEGPKAISAFYRKMYERVLERIEVHKVVIDDTGLAIEITATFSAHEDALDFQVAPIPKNHKISGNMLVLYDLVDGKISDIKIGRMGPISEPSPI